MESHTKSAPPLWEVELRVCDLISEQQGIPRANITMDARLIEDLQIDSLDLVELIMSLEEDFQVQIPDDIGKRVFVESPVRVRTLAKLILHQWGTGKPARPKWRQPKHRESPTSNGYFSQLGGRSSQSEWQRGPLFEPLSPAENGSPQFRRTTDGMRCVLLPTACVEIGDPASAEPDQKPVHTCELSEFLMDAEPVSVLAFCRFLNSAEGITPENATKLCGVEDGDRRSRHFQLDSMRKGFVPKAGTERQPMVLISFHGAAAYAAWANREDWRTCASAAFLPSEAQWEYAARGASFRTYPWGNEEPTAERAWVGLHTTRESYPSLLPLADVNARLGLSPYGLHHMSGNVWQWCRDWYDPEFYRTTAATQANPLNREDTGIRAERGGSWVGPASLAKCSYRRGRPPKARGRCLGFRCIGTTEKTING